MNQINIPADYHVWDAM